MIRLDSAAGDERVRSRGTGLAGDNEQLPHFVAAEAKPDRIVSFDEERESGGEFPLEPIERLQRRRKRSKRNRRK
jgi:hypothetical protein